MNRKKLMIMAAVFVSADKMIQDEEWARVECPMCGHVGFDNKHGYDTWYRCRNCRTN